MSRKSKKTQFMNLKKKVLHFFKNNKKKIVFLSIIVTLFALIYVFVNLGIQIKFLTYDELQVEVEPRQVVLSIKNDEPLNLSFEIQNKNFGLCNSRCEILLWDASDNLFLYNETNLMKSNEVLEKSYSFNVNEYGAGQKIYNLEVTCNNIKSTICKSTELKEYRSAIITVNYNISLEEENYYNHIKEMYPFIYLEQINQEQKEATIKKYIDAIRKSINTSLVPPNISINNRKIFNESLDLYYDQKFRESISLIDTMVRYDFEPDIKNLEFSIERYNNNIFFLDKLSDIRVNEAYEFYKKVGDNRSKIIKEKYDLILNNELSSFYSVSEFQEAEEIYNDINETISSFDTDMIFFENLLKEKIDNQSRILGYEHTLDPEKDTCTNLLLIQNKTREHNMNISFPEESFAQIISFMSEDIYGVESNETHIFIGEKTIVNDGGKNFEEYFSYVIFPELDTTYCTETYFLYEQDTFPQYDEIIINNSIVYVNQDFYLEKPPRRCCFFGVCESCVVKEDNYPIIFVHGHSFNKNDPPESSIEAFSKIQEKLSHEGYIINAGDIDYSAKDLGYWSEMDHPVGVRVTYYYIPYYETDTLLKSIRKEEGIESYSIRLKELIDYVIRRTGAEKVIIVAHSMGGLVTRNYIDIFGEDKIDKIILIGTPNHGVSGRVEQLCSSLGDKKACRDMSEGSIFLKRLENSKIDIPTYTIIGKGCNTDGKDGDGVVLSESSYLDFSENIYINGKCDDFLGTELHSDLHDPDKYPQVYDEIIRIIFRKN